MRTPVTLPVAVSRRMWLVLEIGWAVIVAKCLEVPWVSAHWHVPIQAGWVIVLTLSLAALVTLVIFAWQDEWVTDGFSAWEIAGFGLKRDG